MLFSPSSHLQNQKNPRAPTVLIQLLQMFKVLLIVVEHIVSHNSWRWNLLLLIPASWQAHQIYTQTSDPTHTHTHSTFVWHKLQIMFTFASIIINLLVFFPSHYYIPFRCFISVLPIHFMSVLSVIWIQWEWKREWRWGGKRRNARKEMNAMKGIVLKTCNRGH